MISEQDTPEPLPNTPEFETACNGEIDIIFAHELGDDIIAELDVSRVYGVRTTRTALGDRYPC